MKNTILSILAIALITSCTIPQGSQEPQESQTKADSTNFHPQRTILPKVEPEISYIMIEGYGYEGSTRVYPCIYLTVQPIDKTYTICNQLHKGYHTIIELPVNKISSITFEAESEIFIKSVIVNNRQILGIKGWGVKNSYKVDQMKKGKGKFVLNEGGIIRFEPLPE